MHRPHRPRRPRLLALMTIPALVLGLMAANAVSTPAHASTGLVSTAAATLTPTSASKAPNSNVHATVTLTQVRGVLTATGTATGMDPTGIYLSVLYGPGSNATTCTPDGSLDFGQMLLGIWELTPSGTRVLVAPPKESLGFSGATLSQFNYVSIRETSPMKVQSTQQQLGQTFLLAACGTLRNGLHI